MLESKSDCLMLVLGEQYPTTNSTIQPKTQFSRTQSAVPR